MKDETKKLARDVKWTCCFMIFSPTVTQVKLNTENQYFVFQCPIDFIWNFEIEFCDLSLRVLQASSSSGLAGMLKAKFAPRVNGKDQLDQLCGVNCPLGNLVPKLRINSIRHFKTKLLISWFYFDIFCLFGRTCLRGLFPLSVIWKRVLAH